VQGSAIMYNNWCKKEEGCYPLGKILANTIPIREEDTPHVRIFMEGDCT
jgi:hypothetical protein